MVGFGSKSNITVDGPNARYWPGPRTVLTKLTRKQQEGTKALSEYQAKEEATRLLTAKLRAERLARETVHGKPKSKR